MSEIKYNWSSSKGLTPTCKDGHECAELESSLEDTREKFLPVWGSLLAAYGGRFDLISDKTIRMSIVANLSLSDKCKCPPREAVAVIMTEICRLDTLRGMENDGEYKARAAKLYISLRSELIKREMWSSLALDLK
jgi:hypothetical protein